MIRKHLVTLSLSGVLLASTLMPGVSLAEENSEKEPKTYGHNQETVYRELTTEEIEAAELKEAEVEKYIKEKKQKQEETIQNEETDEEFSLQSTGIILNVPHKKQTKGHWCGPASSLAMIAFKNSTTPSQQDLANDWNPTNNLYGMNTDKYNGTTSPDMARSLNHWDKTNWTWVSTTRDDFTRLWNSIVYVIDKDYPANLLVDTKYLSWYNGKQLSHFVTARGYDQPQEILQYAHLVDPHYSDTYTGYHNNESFSNVFNAVKAQSWRENFVY